MTLKAKLIAEVGKKKAQKLLSDWGKEMNSKRKKPYSHFKNPENARKAGLKAAAKRKAEKALEELENV